MKIKNILLTNSLIITMALTGCSSNEKKPENNGSDVVEETTKKGDFEKMSAEESKNLQSDDVIEKEADRAVLEEKGLDYVYVYNMEIAGKEYEPYVYYNYVGKEYSTKTSAGEKLTQTFKCIEVAKIYYANSDKTNTIMKKMQYGTHNVEVEPIYLEVAKEKVNTK